MITPEEIKLKTNTQLMQEYLNMMDQVLAIWNSTEGDKELSGDASYMLLDIEATMEAYDKEMESRGIGKPKRK